MHQLVAVITVLVTVLVTSTARACCVGTMGTTRNQGGLQGHSGHSFRATYLHWDSQQHSCHLRAPLPGTRAPRQLFTSYVSGYASFQKTILGCVYPGANAANGKQVEGAVRAGMGSQLAWPGPMNGQTSSALLSLPASSKALELSSQTTRKHCPAICVWFIDPLKITKCSLRVFESCSMCIAFWQTKNKTVAVSSAQAQFIWWAVFV